MPLQLAGENRVKIEAFQRKHRVALLSLIFTDLVGSTKMKQELGDQEAIALIHRHKDLVRQLLNLFSEADEIETAGDSFFLVFAKPSDAVKFSLLLQSKVRLLAHEVAYPILDRVGIHVGEVFIEEHGSGEKRRDLYGIQVDICARVTSLADGDQILMTRSAFDNARQVLKSQVIDGIHNVSWLNHGPYVLKGIDEPIDICEVGQIGSAVLKPPPDSEKVHRYVSPDAEPVLGWRPAVDQVVPGTEWELVEKLGEGGFGEVWLGVHRKLKERRVFKFCFRADRVRSLRREVTIFRLLKERLGQHPNIATVYDVYLNEPPFYLTTEFAEGRDLRTWIEAQGGFDQIDPEAGFEVVAQIADALEVAHEAGVIHRDVKPSNILMAACSKSRWTAKLTDFGIGQVVSEEALAGMTRLGFTQTVIGSGSSGQTGTQLYMAPEITSGKPASTQSDIYSLGVVLYQMIVGDLNRPLTVDWAKDIPDPFLRNDLRSCFAGNPEDRFSHARHLATNLRTLEERKISEAKRKAATRRRLISTVVAIVGSVIMAPIAGRIFFKWHEGYSSRQALKNLGPLYRTMRSYEDSALITVQAEAATAQSGGVKQNIELLTKITFAKPDRLDLTIELARSNTKLVSDGTQAWTSVSLGQQPQYTVKQLTNASVETILSDFGKDFFISGQWLGIGPIAGLEMYRIVGSSNPEAALFQNAANIRSVGVEEIDGKPAFVFAWEQTNATAMTPVRMWVRKEDGVIVQRRADLQALSNATNPQTNRSPVQKMAVTSTHRGIKLNAAVEQSSFAFRPAPGSRRVDQFDLAALMASVSASPFRSFSQSELQRQIPARDRQAKPGMIDLSTHYNVPLTAGWYRLRQGSNLSQLPRGLQTLAGVDFDVRGIVQLASSLLKNSGGKYPPQVKIQIRQKCQRLHFLHSAIESGQTPIGTKIARYLIHYGDGQQKEFEVIYGRDIVDWWTRDRKPPTSAVIAWEGMNEVSRLAGSSIRLCKSIWENPAPQKLIEAISFESQMSISGPFLVAITAE